MSALQQAIDDYLNHLQQKRMEQNPAQDIRAPQKEKHLPHTLDVDQMQQLLTIDDDDPQAVRDKATLELFYSSGLRLSERLNLQINNFDQSDNTVRIIGKGNKERIVPVERLAQQALQDWLGHADISTTQVYTHLDFQHLANVYDAAHPRARAGARKRSRHQDNDETTANDD